MKGLPAKSPWKLLLVAALAAGVWYLWTPGQVGDGRELVAWRNDPAAAREEAIKAGKPMFFDFTASWCPDCTWMKTHPWTDATIAGRLNNQYVPVSVDYDRHPELVSQFGIQDMPEFFVVDPKDGKILKAYRKGALRNDAFLAWLE